MPMIAVTMTPLMRQGVVYEQLLEEEIINLKLSAQICEH